MPAPMVWGGGMLVLVVLVAVFGPALSPHAFDAMDITQRLQPPSAAHLLGTDEFGRDVLSRMLVGTRLSLLMGLGATCISLAIGVPLGLLAGYYRGLVDETVMRAMDVMISVPPIMLGLLILAVTTPTIWKSALAVGIIYVPIMVRLTRSVTLELASAEFIEAARGRGDRGAFILFAEILPNAWPSIIVEAALRITFAILLAAALSFLGLGVQPPAADWGLMIAEARPFLYEAPWIALAPGLMLVFTVVAINLVGDGLRESLDPRLRRQTS
ncbi:ABC transporter permease [Geminicoccaceae bacterium 1502E]|nr:ABC transporter permease [Geminicoccaceae bacterium 1502E]